MNLKATLLGAAAAFALAPMAMAERGSDGQLNIIYWQAPSIMNPYLSGGTKELEAASLVIEPLARYDETGAMVPWLAEAVPTVDNGGVSEDLTSITWTLKEGLVWSDGSAVTSEDVRFSWQYCTADGGGCAQSEKFNNVVDVEIVDERTVTVRFDAPKPFPYGPFVGAQAPIIQAAQFADCLGPRAPECTDANFNPVGTGPFTVTEFRPNDVIALAANGNYRDPAKPAFATVIFKGGGDATSAARAVFETGEFDYAWNLQLAPDVLARMEAVGKGTVVSAYGTSVERIMVNMTDVNPDLGDERGTAAHPHPFLTDINVRKAMSMSVDRELLNEVGYGPAGRPTCNVLPGPEIYASAANDNCLVQDIEGAKALLDAAGWEVGSDGVRVKDGVRLSVLYQTSTNAVRQDFQALIKGWWDEIGIETELRNIDASVFFGSDPGSPDTFQKFFADVEMYTNNFDGTDPESYMANWECKQAPRPETQWQGNNMPRYCSEEYDALVAEFAGTAGIENRAAIAKRQNDMLMQDYVIIPLVHRGRVAGHSNALGGVVMNPWDSELWNAADWHRVSN
ncbi:peptide ABC transporter substrate-binding protein [Pseudohalocynthiibacter aestuariivivens]|jgi:peptide/nickel transport system substrate-binding protein|uniref:Peptide ABC transporter substrate-binding protein n=1 Tax=Pseudohalocynthiibacter aestuariivivens TaxID=1591409 RepID=A0ABV5JJ70_9RHOB|nr:MULTISPECIES: peptide ABC transporter substrate-binding protein [Pseudohalocynthiibacter]MBS9716731.1 peptide ABC transporter substrate-binding protein [Pseudohalocynthiibacter aestuariivivens]MCK0101814.1 peptide ABC transporter substrate-binding protein [Pseudohalocynthiibacter sp. F2068]